MTSGYVNGKLFQSTAIVQHINSVQQTAGVEAMSEFTVVTAGVGSHEAEKYVGKIHSTLRPFSGNCRILPPAIDGRDTDMLHVSGENRLLSHRAQECDTSKDGKGDPFSDTSSCALNIQKRGSTTSYVRCTESSNFVSGKTHGAVSRAGSNLEARKSKEKCVQELCVDRKPHHAGLDSAELQQIIHDWDSVTDGDRSDEFSQVSNPLYKDMMPQHEEVIKNPSTVTIQQHIKEKDIHAVHDNQEHSLYEKASVTKEKNIELTMSAKSPQHSESSLVSHAILVELQKVDENICISKNKESEVKKKSKSKNEVSASNVHEMDATKNVKSRKLRSRCSSADRGNFQQTKGLRVTNNVPSSETLVQQSRSLERGSEGFTTSSCKRRLFSSVGCPEVIKLNDYEDISGTGNILFTHSSRGTKKMMFTNRKNYVNKTPIKRLQDDNRERRKTESVPACHEQDQLGGTVAKFGGLSQTAKLDVSKPGHFSKNGFSGRWRNKYLEEVRKRKLEKKCKVNVRRSVNSSVYSDLDNTDSDSDPSCWEPEKPFFTHSSRGTKKTILTNRKRNINKAPIKKLQDDKRERRKTESVPACHEQNQLGGTVARFGGLSQTAKLDVSKSCHFSKKILRGRCHNKYLEEERKCEL